MPPPIRQIPVRHLSYGNRLFGEIGARQPVKVDAIFDAVEAQNLFKSEREDIGRERALSIVRFAGQNGYQTGYQDKQIQPKLPWCSFRKVLEIARYE